MIIELNDVVKKFGNVTALSGIGFTVQEGNTIGLLGPNGSGKTTTMRLLTGMIDPDSGSIRVMEMDPKTQGDGIRANTGVLTENAAMYEWMTARQNLDFFGSLYGLSGPQLTRKVFDLIGMFHMDEYADKKVGGYSTGMKKRLAIARALINDPKLLLLDEPTAGLDPESAQSIIKLIQMLNGEKVTILLCTHNLNEAQTVCDEFVFLDKGTILETGSLAHLKKKYNHKETLLLRVDGTPPAGYEAKDGGISVDIASEDEIPSIIRSVSAACNVYDARLLEHDLSDIYFKVREKVQ
ncbi:MAG: ABC transporter ATP-binding protein [Eubacteriales bacterium]